MRTEAQLQEMHDKVLYFERHAKDSPALPPFSLPKPQVLGQEKQKPTSNSSTPSQTNAHPPLLPTPSKNPRRHSEMPATAHGLKFRYSFIVFRKADRNLCRPVFPLQMHDVLYVDDVPQVPSLSSHVLPKLP